MRYSFRSAYTKVCTSTHKAHHIYPLRCLTIVLLLVLTVTGCVSPTKLTNVLIGDNKVPSSQLTNVSVVRENEPLTDSIPLELKVGDLIETQADTIAVLTFSELGKPNAVQVFVLPNSRVRISSLSFEDFGSAIIRIKRALSKPFNVKNRYITAGAEGTELFVEFAADGTSTVTSLNGIITVQSVFSEWRPIKLLPGNRASIQTAETPVVERLRGEDFNSLVREINRIERVLRPDKRELMVPTLIGRLENDARRLLSVEALINIGIEARITNTAPVGTVVDQNPEAGAVVKTGSRIVMGVEAVAVQVPSVLGLQRSAALDALQAQKLNIGRIDSSITGSVAAGQVNSQHPAAGTVVPEGSHVDIVIELDSTNVPGVIGLSRADAERLIAEARLVRGNINERITGSSAAGYVLEQQPSAGQRLAVGSTVSLTVEGESRVVPGLVGGTVDQARAQTSNSDLGLRIVREVPRPGVAAGTIVSQYPNPSTRVQPGTIIEIEIATELMIVPQVFGQSQNVAMSAISRAGLQVRVSTSQTDAYPANTVIQQAPQAGSQVPSNTIVNLVIATTPPFIPIPPQPRIIPIPPQPTFTPVPSTECIVPNVIGLSWDDALLRLRQARLGANEISSIGDSNRKVVNQSPGASSSVRCGSTVNLSLRGVID